MMEDHPDSGNGVGWGGGRGAHGDERKGGGVGGGGRGWERSSSFSSKNSGGHCI